MEQPGAADLLAIARTTLLDDIIPHLQGPEKFKALMVANAMAIAIRAEKVPDLENAAAICRDIRAGAHDGDHALALRLRAFAKARCRISAPKALHIDPR